MTEKYILDQLFLNGYNYQLFKDQNYKDKFTYFMNLLKKHMCFDTIEEACKHFDRFLDTIEDKELAV